MVYDFYIRETGNFLFFITADSAKAMILMAKGKFRKRKGLGKVSRLKKHVNSTRQCVLNTQREACLLCSPAGSSSLCPCCCAMYLTVHNGTWSQSRTGDSRTEAPLQAKGGQNKNGRTKAKSKYTLAAR